MKPVANLVIEMAANVARLEKDMQAARRSVDGAMQKIQRSAQMAMRALGALGLGLGAAQLAGFVKQAIATGDRMQKLSQQIGIATQNIAGLEMAFRQGGASASDLEMAMARLNLGVGTQTAAYKKLNLQSTDTFNALLEIADLIQTMPDGLEKSALANELFGRSGARLIPTLNQGSEGLRRYIELTQRLGTAVTPEVARQFELYNDTMDDVSESMRGLAMQAAIAIIPTLQSLAEALRDTFADGSVQRGIEILIEALKLLGIAIAGRLIASVAGLTAGMVKLTASLTAGTAAMGGLTASLVGANKVLALMGGSVGLIATVAGGLAYFSEQAYRAETTADGLAEKLGITNAELRSMTRIQIEQKIIDIATELQKLEVQAIETAAAQALLNDTLSDPEAYSIEGGQLSSELGTINKKISSFQELMETLKNRLVETQQESSKTADSLSNIGKSAEDAEDKIRDLIRAYTDETDMMTMNNREKEYFLFLQKMEAEGIEGNTELWKELARVYREAQADRTSVEAVIAEQEADKKRLEDRIEAEKEFAAEAQRINDQIGQSLTDALVEGGMNARDFLIKMFRTLVLRPLIQPIISGVLGAMGLGTAGAALAGGGTEGALSQATGLSGVISTLKGAVDMVTGGFAALGTSVSNLAVDAGFELMSMGFQDAGFAMIDASAALGTAASYLGGIAAGLTAGSMISGQFSVAGSSMVATGIGTAIGAAVGGPIGAAIGGAIGGVVNRAFGMGATTTEATGITGQMSLEGALAEQFTITKQKGGWFRSDKVRTSYEALEGDVLDRLSLTAQNVGQTVVAMAESLGMSADNIQGFSRGFTLGLMGLSEEEINQRVQEEFGYFADALAETINPELWNFKRNSESASEILTRLSTTLTTVNNTFDILGFTLYEASLAGADAAQQLIDMFGGIEQFTAATSFYYENFYSEQERANKQLEQMTELFSTMGLVLPESREAFRAMVEAAQAAGDDALFASLLQIAPAFNNLQVAMEQLGETANNTAAILEERVSLEERLMRAVGDTAGLRQRELEATDASNRHLLQMVYDIEDAEARVSAAQTGLDRAMAALQRSVEAERNAALDGLTDSHNALMESLTAQRNAATTAASVARESVNSLQSLFGYISGQIEQINNDVDASRTAAQGMQFIANAVIAAQRTGYLPTQEELASAITSARGGLGAENFATSFEMRRANLKVAGQLTILGEITGEQLTIAEQQLAYQEAMIERLDLRMEQAQAQYDLEVERTNAYYDQILEDAQAQIDQLMGIDNSILSVEAAVKAVEDAIGSLSSAMSAQAAAQSAARAATSGGGVATATNSRGLQLIGNTVYFPGGGTHSVAGPNGAATLAATYGLQMRANGGFTPPGMTLVGERGPELVDFQRPAMVYTNSELRNAMGGGDMAAEIRQLRQENQAQSRAMVALQARMTRIVEQWDNDGLPQDRYEGATA